MPKTEEELIEFRDKYPEMFEVVQTVSAMQAHHQVSELQKEISVIREREKERRKRMHILNSSDFTPISMNENQRRFY